MTVEILPFVQMYLVDAFLQRDASVDLHLKNEFGKGDSSRCNKDAQKGCPDGDVFCEKG